MKPPREDEAHVPEVVYVLVIRSDKTDTATVSEPSVYASLEIAKHAALIAASPADPGQRGRWVAPVGKVGRWIEATSGGLPAVKATGFRGSQFIIYTCPVHKSVRPEASGSVSTAP